MRLVHLLTIVLGLAAACGPARALNATELLAIYTQEAGRPPVAERGRKMFTTDYGRDLGLSCSSCHGAVPVTVGKDAVTDKAIAPLAPAANPQRFTDRRHVEQQFRLNCRDFVGRDCSAAEKADLLAWLISLKP